MKALLALTLAAAIGGICASTATALDDYGDAPDGGPAGYGNGVVAHFPSLARSNGARHTKWGPLVLGRGVSSETDSRQVDNDPFDDGFAAQLEPCRVSHVEFAVNAAGLPAALRTARHKAYLNAWFDFNRDGRWAGSSGCGGRHASEWGVKNVAISLASFAVKPIQVVQVDVLAGPTTKQIWERATITLDQRAKLRGGRGKFRYGETEDYGPGQAPASQTPGGRGNARVPISEPGPYATCRALIRPKLFQPPGMPGFTKHGGGIDWKVEVFRGRGPTTLTLGVPQVVGQDPAGIVPLGAVPAGPRIWSRSRLIGFDSIAVDFRANPFQLVLIPVDITGPQIRKLHVDCIGVVAHEILTPAGANTYQPGDTTVGQTIDTTVGPPTITGGGQSGGGGGGGSTTVTT